MRTIGFLATAVALFVIVVQVGEVAVPWTLGLTPPSPEVLADRGRYASYMSRSPVAAHLGRLLTYGLGGLVAAFTVSLGRLSPRTAGTLAVALALASVGLAALLPGVAGWVRIAEPAAAAAGVYVGYTWIEATRRRVRAGE